ncbi:MAG TPA: hypothetical protein PLC59_05415 [Bacteroidales bacterium]|nr:hypothetical protein [Bacteroidales bacterium]
MENKYQYVDPEYKYTNKDGVLYNLASIADHELLQRRTSARKLRLKKTKRVKKQNTKQKINLS